MAAFCPRPSGRKPRRARLPPGHGGFTVVAPGHVRPVLSFSVSRPTTASPHAVWELFTEPRHWPSWGLTVRSHEGPERIDLGATGRVQTAVGFWLDYEITSFEPGRSWAWHVAGIPATSHRIDVAGRGVDDQPVVVSFGAPWWAVAYVPVLWWSLRSLVRRAETQI